MVFIYFIEGTESITQRPHVNSHTASIPKTHMNVSISGTHLNGVMPVGTVRLRAIGNENIRASTLMLRERTGGERRVGKVTKDAHARGSLGKCWQ